MSTPDQKEQKPWFARWWGILLILFLTLLLGLVLYIGFYTVRFYHQIQLGDLPTEISGGLTRGNIVPPPQLRENLAYASTNNPTVGKSDAPLQIVEFADFECPYSREESLIIRELMTRYPDKINFVYRDFPLEDVHPHSLSAALAGKCAQSQGKFWAMHDKLYQNSDRLTDVDLKLYALEVGLNPIQFNACLDNRKYQDQVAIDRADGIAAGVVGTPTFFINGRKIAGAIPMELWEQIIARIK